MMTRLSLATAAVLCCGLTAATARAQSLVKDINPGSSHSAPRSLTEMDGVLYFAADDGIGGRELWRSDGTLAGTTQVLDLNAGSTGSNPANFLVVGDVLYFTANDGTNGTELWRTDGTAAGTTLVSDINPGSGSASPAHLVAFGPFLFFAATDGTNGRELWRSDGTSAGTVMVSDINPGSSGSNPSGLVFVGVTLLFAASDGAAGVELWCSLPPWDQTSTAMLVDINPGAGNSSPGELAVADSTVSSQVYFRANDGVNGSELWRSDGTAAGTSMVADINPGSGSSSPGRFVFFGPFLFFSANDGTAGMEPWRSDGTGAGTVMIMDVNPGSASSGAGSPVLSQAGLFFTANDGVHGTEVWRSLPPWDATTTALVRDMNPGSASGIPASLSLASAKSLYSVADNVRILFSGTDGVNGSEPWVTDGTASGTTMVGDLHVGSGNAAPAEFLRIGDRVFFSANDGGNGIELWAMSLGAIGGALAEPFGAGCAGTGGLVPRASGLQGGPPVVGNATFSVDVSDALPSASALLALDLPGTPIALPSGCTFYVPGVLASIVTTTDTLGDASVPLAVPADPALVGGSLFAQWLVVDPAGLFGLASLSDALHLVIGT